MNVYINLPVADLARSRAFFAALGFSAEERFSDDTALAVRLGETTVAMLLTHEKFSGFTPLPVADATRTTEVLIALQLDSREAVDAMAEAALSAGGAPVREPKDHGFMMERAFADPDGHVWEVFWTDPTAMPA